LLWDAAEGLTAILAYSHADAPGSSWVAELSVGDTCQISGPRGSLDLEAIRRPALFIGDETSFGLAHALYETGMAMRDVEFLFEVSSVAESEQVLQELVIRDGKLIQRGAGDAHLAAAEAYIAERLAAGKHFDQFVLSGNASSIGRLSRFLRQRGVPAAQLTTKAYWTADRAGLD
jgi:NADPH-dependent ferric siderophore reductase